MNTLKEKAPRTFTVMCVLTILGNLFLIAANLLKVGLIETGIRQGGIGTEASFYLPLLFQLILLTCLGALLGASMMLLGKRLGFNIYAASMILHLLLTACAMALWAMTIFLIGVAGLLFFYCIIPISFLVYFSTHRAHLS